MEDYSKLEKLPVNFLNEEMYEDAVVVGCDYDLGISIMDKDKKMYLMCLKGPSLIKHSYDYKKFFNHLVVCIKSGNMVSEDLCKKYESLQSNKRSIGYKPTADDCAFVQ